MELSSSSSCCCRNALHSSAIRTPGLALSRSILPASPSPFARKPRGSYGSCSSSIHVARSTHPLLQRSSTSSVTAATAAPISAAETGTSPQAHALVDSLLSLVEGSDRGAGLGEKEVKEVEELIQKLEGYGIAEPLQSPLLFGGWDVVYSSNPTTTGGYYRSAIGRALLNTKQMIQDLEPPASVRNAVSFSAFGNLLDGEISLTGKLEALDSKSVKITFEPPNLKLGSLELQYGGTSRVQIAIIYLDERVRLGRGSRGSLFVFKRR